MENTYIKNTLKTTFNVKGIYTIHYFKYGKNFKINGESHNFWELVYIDAGEVSIVSDKKVFALKQGQAVLHAPNVFHNISTDNEFARSAIVSFECPSRTMSFFKDAVFDFTAYEKELLSKIITEGSKTYEDKLDKIYLTKMTKRANAAIGSEQLIKNYIELLLLSILRNNIPDNGQLKGTVNLASAHSDAIADKIKSMLEENVYGEISLERISEELFFSKTYIKSVFKKNTEMSIIQYYINLKIEEAKKLISQDKYTFTEISDMLGFNSVHYFSRIFKNRVELTPTEYKRSIKVDNLI